MQEWMTMTRIKQRKTIQCSEVIKIMLAHTCTCKCKASKQGQAWWAVNQLFTCFIWHHKSISTMFKFNSCKIIQIYMFKNIFPMNKNWQPINLYYFNVNFKWFLRYNNVSFYHSLLRVGLEKVHSWSYYLPVL